MIDLKVTNAMFELLRTVFDAERELSRESAEILKSNLSAIYEISKRNDMAHLIGFALEKQGLISPEDETFAKFQKQQYLAMYRCEGMEYEIARMRETFEGGGIDFIMLKGSVIRGLYPEGWMRTSSDIDVLVRAESIDEAEKILSENLKYKRVTETAHDRSFYSEGGVHVELHFDLLEKDRANSAAKILNGVWALANKKNNGHEYVLSDALFYFYHIAHLAKHIENAGSGMRPFVDLWLINKEMQGCVSQKNDFLREGNLDRFASLCDELSMYWMEDVAPSKEAKQLELFVINCGIYGSEENRITIDRKKRGGTVGYVWRRLFMPYDVLKQSHPTLKKHKWLMPFFQVARWFKLITGEKTKQAINEIKTSAITSEEDVQKMQEFLKIIGLNKK